MRHPCKTLLVCAGLLVLSACNPVPDPQPATAGRSYGRITFQPCTLAEPVSGGNVEAQCANFAVPENRQAPEGRKITLNLAWLPATDEGSASEDPVFFLAGGPGQAATDHAVMISAALREVRKQRHVVLVDQRGTGHSHPLDCQMPENLSSHPDALDDAFIQAQAKRCVEELSQRADLRFYTTTQAIEDLDAVREALGAQQINLVGVSYGTRVAQQYAGKYPQHTRAIVLDGVAPNDLVVGGEFARRFDQALALQSQACATDAACHVRYPTDLRTRLRALKQRLDHAPLQVTYRDPTSGEQQQGTLTSSTVTGLAHAFSYMPATTALLPLVLDEADQGRYGPLMSLARFMDKQVTGQMARGMQLSVLCAEDADRYRPDPADADTVMGEELSRLFFSACAVWPKGVRPENFNQPLRSSVPALLMSGQQDPVTPPSYGEDVLKGLPLGRHLVLRGQGHNVIGQGCMPKLVSQFIESANAQALNIQCLDTITDTPAFTHFNGWEP